MDTFGIYKWGRDEDTYTFPSSFQNEDDEETESRRSTSSRNGSQEGSIAEPELLPLLVNPRFGE